MGKSELLIGVIGTIPDTETNWIAQSPVYKTPTSDKQLAHRVRALHLKKSKLRLFKGVCITDIGQELWAPRVDKVKVYNTKFGHCVLVTWSFIPIRLEQDINIKRIKLIDDLGYLVQDSTVEGYSFCKAKDTVSITEISIELR
jgi:hypothetical protein